MADWFQRLARWSKTALSPSSPSEKSPPVLNIVEEILGRYSTTVLNIGARWGDAGAWWRIAPVANAIGFDADPEECKRLNSLFASDRAERYVALTLGAEKKDTVLYETSEPACSSLYPPDESLMERFPQLAVIRKVRTHPVSLTTLDAWWESEERPDVSFLKIDTQGSELDILKGAPLLLASCLGCEVEV